MDLPPTRVLLLSDGTGEFGVKDIQVAGLVRQGPAQKRRSYLLNVVLLALRGARAGVTLCFMLLPLVLVIFIFDHFLPHREQVIIQLT